MYRTKMSEVQKVQSQSPERSFRSQAGGATPAKSARGESPDLPWATPCLYSIRPSALAAPELPKLM